MATTDASQSQSIDVARLRDDWLSRLNALVDQVEHWAKELNWSTRRIEKQMKDSQIGRYSSPALLLQKEIPRILLEPIARSAPGADGVVDLYLMPAYDDIASLYYHDDGWHLHYMLPESPTVGTIREAQSRPLTKEALQDVLEEMIKHVAEA